MRAETGAGPTAGKLEAADLAVTAAAAAWAVTLQPSQLVTGGLAAMAVPVVLAGPRSVALLAMADLVARAALGEEAVTDSMV